MLNENIKAIRKSKGLSQEELAIRLNVVRQTVSKWERGLSVPDSDMLIAISEVLETPVSVLLGETVTEPEPGDLKAIAETAIVGTALHAFEFAFVRIAPFAFVGALGGAILTRRQKG